MVQRLIRLLKAFVLAHRSCELVDDAHRIAAARASLHSCVRPKHLLSEPPTPTLMSCKSS